MKGYTLIEAVIAVMLLSIILLGGTTLFFQNLRSSGLSEVELALNSALGKSLIDIEKNVRFSQVNSVSVWSRLDCVSQGGGGVAGDTLTVTDLEGNVNEYSLLDNRIASTAASTGRIVYLTPTNIQVTGLAFSWFCTGGSGDRLKIDVGATSTVLGTGIEVTRAVSSDIDLLNSGIN